MNKASNRHSNVSSERIQPLLRLMEFQTRMPSYEFVTREEAFRSAGLDPHGPSPYHLYASDVTIARL